MYFDIPCKQVQDDDKISLSLRLELTDSDKNNQAIEYDLLDMLVNGDEFEGGDA